MAKRLSLKQRLHFGTKRQRAAAKSSMRAKRRQNAPKRHRARTSAPKARPKKVSRRRATRKHNPGEIISMIYPLGNPAKGRKRSMAKTKRARKRNAGRARTTTRRNPAVKSFRRRRHNPGGQMGNVVTMAVGVAAGALGSKIGAQVVLGTKNTGVMGYAGNAAAGGALAWAAHAFLKKPVVTQSILVGTAVQILLRVIGDYSLVGSYSAQIGVGDYMVSNWVAPQRLPDPQSAMVQIPSGWAPTTIVKSNGVNAQALGLEASRG